MSDSIDANDQASWRRLLDIEDGKRKEKLLDPIKGGDSNDDLTKDPIESFQGDDVSYKMVEVLLSIKKTCESCSDQNCRNDMNEALKNNNFEGLNACPKIYKLLTST